MLLLIQSYYLYSQFFLQCTFTSFFIFHFLPHYLSHLLITPFFYFLFSSLYLSSYLFGWISTFLSISSGMFISSFLSLIQCCFAFYPNYSHIINLLHFICIFSLCLCYSSISVIKWLKK